MKEGDKVFGYEKQNGNIIKKWEGVLVKTYPKHPIFLVEIEGKICSVKKLNIQCQT